MPSSSNIAEFIHGIELIKQATRRAEPDIVNRALRNVAYQAMKETPYAEPGMIQAELYRDNILLKLASTYVTRQEGKATRDKSGNWKRTKKGKLKTIGRTTRAKIAAAATRLLKLRISGSRAMRAGWIKAILMLGGAIRGGAKLKAGGSTSEGGAKLATFSNPTGSISNTLVTKSAKSRAKTGIGAIDLAEQALERAVATVAGENIAYAKDKMDKLIRRLNAQK